MNDARGPTAVPPGRDHCGLVRRRCGGGTGAALRTGRVSRRSGRCRTALRHSQVPMIGWFRALVSACSDIALPRLRLQLMVQVTGVWDLTADTLACNQERTRGPRKLVVRTRGGCSSKRRGPPSRHPVRCARSMSVSVPTDARAGCSSRHKSRYVSIAMRGLPESTRSVARASHQLPAGRQACRAVSSFPTSESACSTPSCRSLPSMAEAVAQSREKVTVQVIVGRGGDDCPRLEPLSQPQARIGRY